jgi:hypothetical protein
MAILTNQEKARIRNILAEKFPAVTWPKAAVDAAAQVVEDFLTDNQATVAGSINTATVGPHGVTFTANQKKVISAAVFLLKYGRDIV